MFFGGVYLYNYIVNDKIYSYKSRLGICEHTKGTENVILKNATDKFFVYGDKNKIKLVSYNKNHELIYMVNSRNVWNSYVIATLNKDIEVKKIMVASNGKNENLFYSARLKGETVLVHCVLGNNAMPSVIGKMINDEFYVYKKSVYFTNGNGIIGYCDFSDSKPEIFNACFEGELSYVTKGKIVYKKGDDIFINDKKCCSDKNAEIPIVVNDILMWKSGSYIRYISDNEKVRQYVSGGVEPQIFVISDAYECIYHYGTFSNGNLKLFS